MADGATNHAGWSEPLFSILNSQFSIPLSRGGWLSLLAAFCILSVPTIGPALPLGPGPAPRPGSATGEPPQVSAAAAVLVSAATGQVLYARNADAPLAVASLTKIMTAVLICEEVGNGQWAIGNGQQATGNGQHYTPHAPRPTLHDLVEVSPRAAAVRSASPYLKPGSQVRLGDLLWLVLLHSDNVAADACAEAVSGSVEAFVDRMNARAAEMGLRHTHFANPHGLDAPGHLSTAREVAEMARYALTLPPFAAMVRTRHHVIADPRDPSRPLVLKNRNRLLDQLPGAIGVKTGTTLNAGDCVCGALRAGDQTFVAVILGSPHRYAECGALLRWAAENFRMRNVLTAGEAVTMARVRGGARPWVEVAAAQTVRRLLPADSPLPLPEFRQTRLTAPVAAGTRAGTLICNLGDDRIRVWAVTVRSLGASPWFRILHGPGCPLTLLWLGLLIGSGAILVRRKAAARRRARARKRTDEPEKRE